MPIQPVRGLGSVGIVQDTPSVLLPPEAWSDGRNVRFHNESVSKISGHLSILDTPGDTQVYTFSFTNTGSFTRFPTLSFSLPNAGDTGTITVSNLAISLPQRISGSNTTYALSGADLVEDVQDAINSQATGVWTVAITSNGFTITASNPGPFTTPGTLSFGVQGNFGAPLSGQSFTVTTAGSTTNPQHLVYWPRPITQYYIYTDATNIFRIDQSGTSSNINRTVGGAYDATGLWHSTLFNGGYTVVLNNTRDIPQFITYAADNSDTNVADLPNWNYGTTTVTAQVLRSFGNVLVAGNLNVTTDGTTVRQPSTVRVSTRAAPGGLPATWEPGTGAATADEFELSTPEQITDIAEISRGQAIIYTRNSFWSLTVDATASRVRQLNNTYGCRSINCVTTFEGQHFVVGLNDVYVHSGSGSIQSVIEGKFRDYLYDNLHPTFADNIFTTLNSQEDEVWICFPNLIAGANGGRCNEALIWNYRHNTWTKRDLPNILDATEGPSTGGGLAAVTYTFTGDNTGTTTLGTNEVQRTTVSGSLSAQVDAVAEVQRVAISGDLNAGVIGAPEVQTATFSGSLTGGSTGNAEVQTATVSGTLDATVAGVSEIQHADYTGTRSNVVTPTGGQNEIYQVQLDSNFNSGDTIGAYPTPSTGQISFGTTNSVTHSVGNSYSWPTSTPSIDAGSGWTYTTPGTGSGSSVNVGAVITNNTGQAFTIPANAIAFQVVLNITSLPASGSTRPSVFAQAGANFILGLADRISSTGRHTVNLTSAGASTIPTNGTVRFYVLETEAADQGFTYTVDAIRISPNNTSTVIFDFEPSSGLTSYSINLNTGGGTQFPNLVSGMFTANANASTALGEIRTAIESAYPATSSTAPVTTAGITSSILVTHNNGTAIATFAGISVRGELVLGGASTSTSLSTDFSNPTVDELVMSATDNDFYTVTRVSSTQFRISSTTATITQFRLDGFSDGVLTSVTDEASTATTFTLSGNVANASSRSGRIGFSTINIDTAQQTNLSGSLTLTANGGTRVAGVFNSGFQDGNAPTGVSNMATTYTVNDYANREVTSFTSSVLSTTASDFATVNTTIINAINSNTETPVDFLANNDSTNTRIILTGQSAGAVSSWSISTNNHGVSSPNTGNIVYTISTATEGVTPVAAEQVVFNITPPGGTGVPYTTTGTTARTASDIAGQIRSNVTIPGWTLSGSGANVVLTSNTNIAPTQLFSFSETNTGVSVAVVETTAGIADVTSQQSTITFIDSNNVRSSYTTTGTGARTASDIAADIRANATVTGWTLSGSGADVVLTNNTGGNVRFNFVVSATSGISATVVETTRGLNGVPAEQATFTVTPPGGTAVQYTTTGEIFRNASQIAENIRNNISIPGWTAGGTSSNVDFTSNTAGVVEGTFTVSDNNAGVSSSVSTVTEGAAQIDANQATFTISPPSGSDVMYTTTGTTLRSSSDIAQQIRSGVTIPGWTLGGIGSNVDFTSTTPGPITSLFTISDDDASVSTSTVVEVTGGVDDTMSGILTVTITIPNEALPTETVVVTRTLTNESPADVAAEFHSIMNPRTEFTSTYTPGSTVVEIEDVEFGRFAASFEVVFNPGTTLSGDSETPLTASVSSSGIAITDRERPWPRNAFNLTRRFLIMAGTNDSTLFAADLTNQFNGQDFTAFVERTSLDMGDLEATKWTSSIYPLIDGTGTVTVRASTSNAYGGTVDLSAGGSGVYQGTFNIGNDYKLDTRVNGRFANYRFESTDGNNWRLAGFSLNTDIDDRR